MKPSRLTRLTEFRRALPLLAAALLLIALTLPMWRITLTAPQYPGEPLPVEVYAYPHLGGEWKEVQGLNKYAGFYYPDPVYVDPNYEVQDRAIDTPEWVLGPVVFVGLALASVVTSVLPTDRIERAIAALFGGAVAVFATMAAIIQYRLHQAGHSLDPDAPLMGIDPFTPPILGSYEVANISGTAGPGPGGVLAIGAVVLLGVAFHYRDSSATVTDLPALARDAWRRLRDRVGRGDSDDRSGPDPDDRPRVETDGGRRPDAGAARPSDRADSSVRTDTDDSSGDGSVAVYDRHSGPPSDGGPP
ncbi:hypothetical protein ACFQGT_07540 [Natrialbaceae archaeon GCM10025810]|uniref:hypothetical protein n=1 Tax=Halovalidus salilacus TaxID=3075124 RepID=UPI00361B03B1